jgi:hypothetical protein
MSGDAAGTSRGPIPDVVAPAPFGASSPPFCGSRPPVAERRPADLKSLVRRPGRTVGGIVGAAWLQTVPLAGHVRGRWQHRSRLRSSDPRTGVPGS